MTVHQVACAIVAGPPLALCAIWLTHDAIVAARSARVKRISEQEAR